MFNRIYIEITNICNLNCDFCPNLKREMKSMSKDEFEQILIKIKDYTKHIYLHVKGEPLIHKDLDKILYLSNKYNLNVNITTNARLLKEKLNIINNNKIRQINISLHSFNSKDEIKELLNTIDKIKDINISLRLWNNKDNKDILNIIENHYNTKININEKRSVIKNNIYLDKDSLFKWPDINNDIVSDYGTCKGGKSQLAILVDGKVVPCCLDNDGIIDLGNIFNSSLEDILNSDRYKNMVKGFNDNKIVENLCKRCEYRNRFK